jgi:hypothetical protein
VSYSLSDGSLVHVFTSSFVVVDHKCITVMCAVKEIPVTNYVV